MKLLATIFVFLLVSSAVLSNAALAQHSLPFTFTVADTTATFTTGDEYVFEGTIKNTSDSALSIYFHRNQHPQNGWISSVCFGLSCYPSFLDSASQVWNPGESREFQLHVVTPASTSGTMPIYIRIGASTDNPADTVGILFTAIGESNSAVADENARPATLTIRSVSPNPVTGPSKHVQVRFFAPESGAVQAKLIDLLGREISSVSTASNGTWQSLEFATESLPAGSYLVLLQSASGASASQRVQVMP